MKQRLFALRIRFLPLIAFASLCMPFSGYAEDSGVFYEPSSSKENSPGKSDAESSFQVTIDPRHRTTLSAEIASPVEKIYKKMGESFKKGELLIKLNDVLFQSNLKKAEAAVEKGKVELDAKNNCFKTMSPHFLN